MSWFRTHGGRLIHGVGGLAAAYAERGWTPVTDEEALAEVGSGEAQARADVEGELAVKVDEIVRRADEAKAMRQKGQTPLPKPAPPVGELTVAKGTPPPLTAEDQAAVQKAIDEESPR